MKIGLDLDGTLISCRERQMAVLGLFAKALHLEIDLHACWTLKREGLGNRAMLIRLGIAPGDAEKMAVLWEQVIEDVHWLAYDRLLPRVSGILQRWAESGHSLHLISARRNKAGAVIQLQRLGLVGFASLDFVDPFVLDSKRCALERVRPDIYIGDTERDFFCAQAANIEPFLLCSGLRSRAYLEQVCNASVSECLAQLDFGNLNL